MKTLTEVRPIALIAILLIGAESGFAQSGVHRFGAITAQPDRTVSLGLLGGVPPAFLNYFDLYPLEASTNLANWTPLGTLVRTNLATNALAYLDGDAPGFAHRFYRMPTNQLFTALAMDHIDCRTTVFPDGTAVRGIFTDTPTEADIDTAVAGRLSDDLFVLDNPTKQFPVLFNFVRH